MDTATTKDNKMLDDIQRYESLIKDSDKDPHPYNRLMIHYRKQKAYKEELRVVKRALQVFYDQLKRQQAEMFRGSKSRSAIKKLSEEIGKKTGLIDKKGNATYVPEQMANWEKRKKTIEEKIDRQKRRK
jgi:hypothetical protein